MTCKHAQAQMDAFIDGELATDAMSAMRSHFERCVCCSQEFQALRLLKKEIANLSAPPMAPDFEERLIAHVRHSAAIRPESLRRRVRVGVFAAAIAAVATLASMQSLADSRRASDLAEQRRFELRQDQAIANAEDPFSGGSFILPASYGR